MFHDQASGRTHGGFDANAGLRAQLKDAWSACTHDLYGLDPTDPGGVRCEQFSAVMRYVPFLCMASLASALILVGLSLGEKPLFLMLWWLTCIAAVAYQNLRLWWRGRHKVYTHTTRAAMRRLHLHAFCFGLLWAMAFPFFALGASGPTAVATAMITTGIIYGGLTIVAAPAAALLYIAVTSAGAMVTLALLGPAYALPIMPPLLVYTLICLIVTATYAMQARDRIAGREAVMRRDESIERLLIDLKRDGMDWLWRVDASGRLASVSAPLADALGMTRAEAEGVHLTRIVRRIRDRRARREAVAAIRDPHAFRELRVPVIGTGGLTWWSVSGYVLRSASGEYEGMRGVGCDVTAERDAQDRIEKRASSDALTGLANRFAFDAALRDALESDRRGGGIALHCLDLDGFKPVNDTYGHAAGDALLRTVAERLKDCVRDTDFVARLGGDEFAIIQTGVMRPSDAERLGERIIETIAAPCLVGEVRLAIGVSVGIHLPAPSEIDGDEVCEKADVALYGAKAAGRGMARVFTPAMRVEAETRRRTERALREALEADGLDLHYQPIEDVRTGRTIAFEALLRWPGAPEGLTSPAAFLPLAEETGLIREIGVWIIRAVCRRAARWPDGVGLTINLAVSQLREPGLVDRIREALEENGVAPERITLEVRETDLPTGMEKADVMAALHDIRTLGVRIGLDDFGTGATSLASLRDRLFDQVKIDRSLIKAAQENEADAALASAVIGLARSLGLFVVAEGVESRAQLDWVRLAGCDGAQGYLLDPPLVCREAERRLERASEKASARVDETVAERAA